MKYEKAVNMKPCPFCGGKACFIGDTRCIIAQDKGDENVKIITWKEII